MILNKKGLLYFSTFLIVFVFYCILQLGNELVFYEFLWLGLKIGIAFFLLYQLFLNNKYSYSLRNILYIFFLTFLILAPLGQYFSDVVFWGADSQTHSILKYIQADLYIIIFLAFFYISYNLHYNIFKKIRGCPKTYFKAAIVLPYNVSHSFIRISVFYSDNRVSGNVASNYKQNRGSQFYNGSDNREVLESSFHSNNGIFYKSKQ